jgi:hypothetical protein
VQRHHSSRATSRNAVRLSAQPKQRKHACFLSSSSSNTTRLLHRKHPSIQQNIHIMSSSAKTTSFFKAGPFHRGISTRGSRHCSAKYQEETKEDHHRRVYAAIGDPDNPLKRFDVATWKETIIDKPFERFTEARTRQLLGTNANIPRLR